MSQGRYKLYRKLSLLENPVTLSERAVVMAIYLILWHSNCINNIGD